MSLKELMIADVDDVFLNIDDHADDVTRYPLGVIANAVTVTAVVDFVRATTQNEFGLVDVVTGTMLIGSAVTVHRNDTWLIDGNLYVTTTITPSDMRGMKIVEVKATAAVQRNAESRGVL